MPYGSPVGAPPGTDLATLKVSLQRLLVDACPVGVAVTRLDGGRLRYVTVNAAFAALLGRSADELADLPVAAVVLPDDVERLEPGTASPEVPLDGAYRHRHAAGHVVHLRVRSAPLDGAGLTAAHFISYATDISAAVHAESQAAGLSLHDELTGLLSRRGFELELGLVDDPSGVIVFGLDGFSEINSTYGGAAGDEVLRTVAELLRARFDPPAVLARLGGDEFGVLVREPDPGELAGRFLADLRDTLLPVGPERLRLTSSAGVRCWQPDADPLADAALALALAKDLGRDRLVVDRDGTTETSGLRERRHWSDRVRHALAEDGFCLVEQPITRIHDGVVERSELLLRLRDHDGGLVAPDRFLPAAERSGQIRAIDRWVLGEATELLAARQTLGLHRNVHINLSAASLMDADTVDAFVDRLRRAPVDPSELTFEVTETVAVRQMQVAERLARSLAELGCGFAVDDFGAGWASFSYLRHLPVTLLKIDGSFVRGTLRSQRDRTTVRAMVDIAREYRIQTIAEAVEDAATLELLAELGVDFAQGHHLGRPRPAEVETP